jgi:FtsH-binding integral membrane protein
MNSNEHNNPSVIGNSNNNKYFKKVFTHFFFALLVTMIGMVVGKIFIPVNVAWMFGVVALIVLVIVLIKRFFDKKEHGEYGLRVPFWLVYGFASFLGVSIYPIISSYVASGSADVVLLAFGVTVVLFFSLALYAYKSTTNFSFLGPFLFVALITLVLLSLVGIFVGTELTHLALAYVGVVIFSGYVIYDISRIKFVNFTDKDVPGAVLNLYLDFLNLFLDILRIVGFWSKD